MKLPGLRLVLALSAAALLVVAACDSDDGGGDVTCDPACDAGQVCSNEGVCVDTGVTCDPACGAGEACSADGTCVATAVICDPACGTDEICGSDGTCALKAVSCDPACGAGQACATDGTCVDLAVTCAPACAAGEVCAADGTCVAIAASCEPACGAGQACSVDGACVDLAVTCDPACGVNQVCSADGTCADVVMDCDPACDASDVCINGACIAITDHTTFTQLMGPFADGPEVTAQCLKCHTDKAQDFMKTDHWNWTGPTPGLQGHETGTAIGKKNVINNFCVAVTSNEARCTQCHAGYGYADDTFDFTDAGKIDCLVCHDTSGTYKKAPKTAGGADEAVDLALVARSVGETSRASCGNCHFNAGGGDFVKILGSWAKDPTPETDVHMGNGVSCADCHAAEAHTMAGGGGHTPVQEAELACTSCHQGPVIHEDNALLDSHAAHVACETCHIPTYARAAATKVEWYWETAGDQDRVPVMDAYGKPDYDPMKGEFVWGMDVEPTLAWSNGTFTRMVIGDTYESEPVDLGSPLGWIDDPAAKIAPFKVMIGNQPADTVNKVVAVPHLFGLKGGPNPYWAKWDWALAISEGMAAAGVDYSGTFGFVDTTMHMELHHEVTAEARGCNDCHNGGIDFTELGYSGDPMVVGGEHATE